MSEKLDNEMETAHTVAGAVPQVETNGQVQAATFGDLFKAEEMLLKLEATEFPAKVAIKVDRILRRLDVDRQPLLKQWNKTIIRHGAEEHGMFVLKTAAQFAAASADIEPAFEHELTADLSEKLTLGDMGSATTPIPRNMFRMLWFLIEG